MNGIQKAIKILAICFGVIIIVNIFGWIIFGISFFVNITDSDSKQQNVQLEDMKEYRYSFEEYNGLNEIEIEIPYSALNIVTGAEELLVETNQVTYNTEVILKNGKLKIKETDHWLWKTKVTGAVNIKLPKGISLNELDIDTGAGKVTIDGVNAENLRLEHGAGKLEITDSNFEKTRISTGAGETKIMSSVLNDLRLEAGVRQSRNKRRHYRKQQNRMWHRRNGSKPSKRKRQIQNNSRKRNRKPKNRRQRTIRRNLTRRQQRHNKNRRRNR